MAYTREEHEELLVELTSPDLTEERKFEILQNIRADHGEVVETISKNTQELEHLRKDNLDLTTTNSRLFRQQGIEADPELSKQQEEKDRHQTITIDDIINQPKVKE
ncbi:head morphogenesis protein [Bacillus phage vB_Bpu_PumA2]|uniref:Head morphogenesis protein n=1 Tax=Bacillus phage vB_Bpu_PumA2 TaxID=2662128 RepID=A0A5Q2WAA5_9CAUD|nr:head scaffolding protein [Bacillus phage vB_Bpu_PumA2]QGH74233.1 head morphogenesis protein [Bacillus phage vB_Bpu_PumA2]